MEVEQHHVIRIVMWPLWGSRLLLHKTGLVGVCGPGRISGGSQRVPTALQALDVPALSDGLFCLGHCGSLFSFNSGVPLSVPLLADVK